MNTMQKRGPKTHKPVRLRFSGSDDYEKLNSSKEFKNFIFGETIKALKFAINSKKKKIDLWVIEDSGDIVSVKNDKYKSILENAIKFYSEQEQFEKCTELEKLIKKI